MSVHRGDLGELAVGDFVDVNGWDGVYRVERYWYIPGQIDRKSDNTEAWWPEMHVQLVEYKIVGEK